MKLKFTITAALLALSFSVFAATNDDDNPEMQGLPKDVPSTSVSKPAPADLGAVKKSWKEKDATKSPDVSSADSAPDDEAAIRKSDEIDVNTIKDDTPPGTTKSVPSDNTTMIQHQLFFHIKNGQCGKKIEIKLVTGDDTASKGANLNIDHGITPNDFTFAAVSSNNKGLDINIKNNLLTATIPSCNGAAEKVDKELKKATTAESISQAKVMEQADKEAESGKTTYDDTDTNTDTSLSSLKKNDYNFSVMIKVPAKTNTIALRAKRSKETKLMVNTVGKDPTIMSEIVKTVINLQP